MPINKRDIIILSADMWTPEEMNMINLKLQEIFPLFQFMIINRIISSVSTKQLKQILREQIQNIETFEKSKWSAERKVIQ